MLIITFFMLFLLSLGPITSSEVAISMLHPTVVYFVACNHTVLLIYSTYSALRL